MRCAIAMWPRCNAVARGRTVPEQGCGKRSRLADNTCSSYLLSRMYRAYIRHRGIMSCQRQPRCSAKQLVAGLREYRREPVRAHTLICSAKRIRKFVERCTVRRSKIGWEASTVFFANAVRRFQRMTRVEVVTRIIE